MTAEGSNISGSRLRRGLIWQLACAALILFMALALGRFFDAHFGFTSLLSIGSRLEPEAVTALREVPHHVYDDSYGYDGAYYVQIAMHPGVDHPELPQAIDNLHYRARRIALSWIAWAAGLGRPEWIVQVFPMLNIVSWLALAWLLWRWLPPNGPENFLRWGGVLLSHGVCMSLRHSLADGPSLLLTAAAVALWEKQRGRGALGVLAAAALTKETSLLAGTLFAAPPALGWRWWTGQAVRLALLALPLAAWLAYLRYRLGPTPADAAGLNNFTYPLAGLVQKWAFMITEVRRDGWLGLHVLTMTSIVALTVQIVFLLARWRPGEVWWRVGAVFAGLGLLVSQPVWEGYPGAATRVLLPMTLAFNLLVPRGPRWWPVLLLGNLSVLAGLAELKPPVRDFFRLSGEKQLVAAVTVERGEGWHQAESNDRYSWRWARERAVLKITNRSKQPMEAQLWGRLSGITARHFGLRINGRQVWDTPLWPNAKAHHFPPITLPPGTTLVEFATDQPAVRQENGDPRELSLCVSNLVITIAPAAPQAQP